VESLREWRRRSGAAPGPPQSVPAEPAEQELARLRRENRELRLRCEILKKTVGIFSEIPASDSPRSRP
jgi:transposase-like protein